MQAMIGGGRIGQPPGSGVPPSVRDVAATPESATAPKEVAKDAGKLAATPPRDQFEKAVAPKAQGPLTRPTALAGERSASTDVLRLARENPAAARQLVAQLSAQTATTLSEIEREMAGARALLEKLANERFTKSARDKAANELKRKREQLSSLKLRHTMTSRKAALLQQVAGKLGDPRLDEEIDRILNHHHKLQTDWGKRHHLLSVGGDLFGADAETPVHLAEVVRTGVRVGGQGEVVADALREISPQAVIAELIARTIDGSTRTEPMEKPSQALRGEFGKPLQNYAMLAETLDDALSRDPFGKD